MKAMIRIIDRFDLGDLFNPSLPKLKTFFYQMDRLVGIVHDDLKKHLKEEGCSTTLFASAWFITIFSSSLKQNTEDEIVNESLLELWDYFLCVGWRAIVKMGVYVICRDPGQLLGMPFEEIMPAINESVRKVLTQKRQDSTVLYEDVHEAFSGLHFTWHMQRLANDFDRSHEEIRTSQPERNN